MRMIAKKRTNANMMRRKSEIIRLSSVLSFRSQAVTGEKKPEGGFGYFTGGIKKVYRTVRPLNAHVNIDAVYGRLDGFRRPDICKVKCGEGGKYEKHDGNGSNLFCLRFLRLKIPVALPF
jgi:hypothetical protein